LLFKIFRSEIFLLNRNPVHQHLRKSHFVTSL
jgi:hypothetical protein